MSRPEPVLVRQAVASLFVLLGLLGYTADQPVVDAVSTLVVFAAPLVAAHLARREVTPKLNPRDDEGRLLEPVLTP